MIQEDLKELTLDEKEILDGSFDRAAAKRRTRGVLLSAFAVLVSIFLFFQLGFSAPWFALMALTILAISAGEKVSYQRRMAVCDGLIVKLVHRIERLEGVPLTPDETPPSRAVQKDPESRSVA